MINTDVLPHLLTIDELAEHLGVTVRHVRRQIAERRVPYIKVGRLVRFDPDEISEWINVSPSLGRRPGPVVGDVADQPGRRSDRQVRTGAGVLRLRHAAAGLRSVEVAAQPGPRATDVRRRPGP